MSRYNKGTWKEKRIIRNSAFSWLSVSAFVAASSASHFATQKYYFSNSQEVSFQNLLFSIGIEKYEISEYDCPKNLSENELLEAFEKLQSFTRNLHLHLRIMVQLLCLFIRKTTVL